MAKMFTVEKMERGSDGREMRQRIEIPDGRWVAFASSGASWEYPDDPEDRIPCVETSRRYTIVGPKPNDLIVLDRARSGHVSSGSSWSHVALVGDAPFGVIFEEREAGERRGGLYFLCSREVWKGELGRRPKITRPQFARPAPETALPERNFEGKPIHARDRRRGKNGGWCRLVDLAVLVGLKPRGVVARFFPFTHAEHPALDVIIAAERRELHCQKVPQDRLQRFYEDYSDYQGVGRGVQDLFRDHRVEEIWVRQGWALSVLYLKHFGYVPPLPDHVKPAAFASAAT